MSSGLSLGSLVEQLASVGAQLRGEPGVVVTDVFQDSREVQAGSLFVARQGEQANGLQFVEEALRRGAVAVLTDASVSRAMHVAFPELSIVETSRVEEALAIASEAVHNWPSRALRVVGVTGTNGKTTLTWIVAKLLEALGIECGQIGTLGTAFCGSLKAGTLTTPPADHLSRTLAAMRRAGLTHVVMEVSNVALVQKRVEAITFDVAAFTNFTRDHLDFHGTLDAYFQAKSRLFTSLKPRAAVFNTDDAKGQGLADRSNGKVSTVGCRLGADVNVSGLRCTSSGIEGSILASSGKYDIASPLLGAHNIENIAVALGILQALGVDLAGAVESFAGVGAPPGRLERCDGTTDTCTVLVDYAHTPDALIAVLDTLRKVTKGRLLCVFGCGGDRDPGKRAIMGTVVADRADYVVVTSDNPRGERPEEIAAMVVAGIEAVGASYTVQLDRAEAIEQTVLEANPGDMVLIAGKGHETYQEACGIRVNFDDRVQARSALTQRRLKESRQGS